MARRSVWDLLFSACYTMHVFSIRESGKWSAKFSTAVRRGPEGPRVENHSHSGEKRFSLRSGMVLICDTEALAWGYAACTGGMRVDMSSPQPANSPLESTTYRIDVDSGIECS